jgi:two-component system response regulator PhcR
MEAAHRNLTICQKLMAGFMQSTHTAFADTETSPIQAARLVQLLGSEVSPALGESKDAIKLDIQDDFFIETKQNLVYLCLLNIVQNSIQALQNQPEKPSIQIKLKDRKTPVNMAGHSIRVTDNGPGMTPTVLARVMANRIPIHKEINDNHSGTGLMFCKKIMLSLNGNISIQSTKAGTAVTLHFPFNKKDDA